MIILLGDTPRGKPRGFYAVICIFFFLASSTTTWQSGKCQTSWTLSSPQALIRYCPYLFFVPLEQNLLYFHLVIVKIIKNFIDFTQDKKNRNLFFHLGTTYLLSKNIIYYTIKGPIHPRGKPFVRSPYRASSPRFSWPSFITLFP